MMLTLFHCLLRLYPAGYLSEYAGEMSWVFQQKLKDIERRGMRGRLSFAAHEIAGLVGGAFRQRFPGSEWNSFRRFNMPLFRFPRATIFLMLAALAGLLAAIHMGALFCGSPRVFNRWLGIRCPVCSPRCSLCSLSLPPSVTPYFMR
jgi:hypothetical protein